MKKLKLTAILALSVGVFTSCEKNNTLNELNPENQIEEIYTVNNFTEVEIGSAFEVVVIPGNEFRITANGDEKDIDDLNVRVTNNRLKVNYLNGNIFDNVRRNRVKILIETPALDAIEVSGAANVDIEKFIYFPEFTAEVTGASKLNLDVKLGELVTEIRGASTLTLYQETPFITADLAGASKLDANDAYSEEVHLELSGASQVNVTVSKYLKVNASGASNVIYDGTPRIDHDLSGASSVKKK